MMYKIPLSELKAKIIASGGFTLENLEQRLKAKINELSGLISEEGAAHIIANELNINLISENREKLKVKEIYAGMRHVSALGKVIRKYEIREFMKKEAKGKVASFILGDETGTIRVVLWNQQAELLADLREDDVIFVKEAYVKEGNNGKELHLGEKGSLDINPVGETVKTVRSTTLIERKKIEQLQPGEERVEILGTINKVFNPNYFNVCSQCAKRVQNENNSFQCREHGLVQPALSYVLNAVLEDESGEIRCTFWKNQTLHLLQQDETKILQYRDNVSSFEEIKQDLEGEQMKLIGKVQKNEMFSRLEFNVQLVEKADPAEELARLEKLEK